MKLLALGTSGRTVALGRREVVRGSRRAASLDLPRPFAPKERRFQQDTLRLLRRIPWEQPGEDLEQEVVIDHPVARCPDAESHVKWARRAARTGKRLEYVQAELRRTGVGLVEDFEAIEHLLEERGYLNRWQLTPRGQRLRFVYNELDLLIAEALERGLMWELTVEELAAFASCFIYEPRTDERTVPVWPTAQLAGRWDELDSLWGDLVARERALRLPLTRRPDPGFAALSYDWASGIDLDDLGGLTLAPGDFVRVSRQLVDLVRQLRDISPELADEARAVLAAIDRGVVAAMGVR